MFCFEVCMIWIKFNFPFQSFILTVFLRALNDSRPILMYGNSYSCIRQCVKKGNKIKYIGLFFDCISPLKPLREERILLHSWKWLGFSSNSSLWILGRKYVWEFKESCARVLQIELAFMYSLFRTVIHFLFLCWTPTLIETS